MSGTAVQYWFLANDIGLFTDLWRNISSDCSGNGYVTYKIESFESMSCFNNIAVMPVTAQQWATMQSSVRELLRAVYADQFGPFTYITFTTFDNADYTRCLQALQLEGTVATTMAPVYFSSSETPIVTASMRDILQQQSNASACIFTWDDHVVYVLPKDFFADKPPPSPVQSAIRSMRLFTHYGLPATSDITFDWTANRLYNKIESAYDLIAGRVNRFECTLSPSAYQLWSTDPMAQVYWIWIEQDSQYLQLAIANVTPNPTSNRLTWDLLVPSQKYITVSMKLLSRSGMIQPSAMIYSFARIAPYVCFLPTSVSVVRDASGSYPAMRQSQRTLVQLSVSGGDVPLDAAMFSRVTIVDGSGTVVVASQVSLSRIPRIVECWFRPTTSGQMRVVVVVFSAYSSPTTATLTTTGLLLYSLPAPVPSNGGILSSYVIADRVVQVDCPFDFASSDTFQSPALSVRDLASISSDPSGNGIIVADSAFFSNERTVSFRFRAIRTTASSELRFRIALDATTTHVFRMPAPAVVVFPTADELRVSLNASGQVTVGNGVTCSITYPTSMSNPTFLRASVVTTDTSGSTRSVACVVTVSSTTTTCTCSVVAPSSDGLTGTLVLSYGGERALYPRIGLVRTSDVYVFPTTCLRTSDALQCEQRTNVTLAFDRPTIVQSVYLVEATTKRVFVQGASPIRQTDSTWTCVILPLVEDCDVSVGVTMRAPDGTTRNIALPGPSRVLPKPTAGTCVSSLLDPSFWVVSRQTVRIQCPFVFRGGDANAFSASNPSDAFASLRMDPSGVGTVGDVAYAPNSAQRTIQVSVYIQTPVQGISVTFQLVDALCSFAIPIERIFTFPRTVSLSVVSASQRCFVGRPTSVALPPAIIAQTSTFLTASAAFYDTSGNETLSSIASHATQHRFDVVFPRKTTYDASVQLHLGSYYATYSVPSVVGPPVLVETPSRIRVIYPSPGLRQSQESPMSIELVGGDASGSQPLAVGFTCDDGRRVDAGVIWSTLETITERSWRFRCIPSISASAQTPVCVVLTYRLYNLVEEVVSTDRVAILRCPYRGDTIPPCVPSSTPGAPGYILLSNQLVRVTFPFVFPDNDGFWADVPTDNFSSIVVDPSGLCEIRNVEYESNVLKRSVVCAIYTRSSIPPTATQSSVGVTFTMRDYATRYVFQVSANQITSLPERLASTFWAPGIVVVGSPMRALSTIDPSYVRFSNIRVDWVDATSTVISSSDVPLESYTKISYQLNTVPVKQSYTICITFKAGPYESRVYSRLDASQIYRQPSDIVPVAATPRFSQWQKTRIRMRIVGGDSLDGSGISIRDVRVFLQDGSGVAASTLAPDTPAGTPTPPIVSGSGIVECTLIPLFPSTSARVFVAMRVYTQASEWTECNIVSSATFAIAPAPTAGAHITSTCAPPYLLAQGRRCVLNFPFQFATSADASDGFMATIPTDHFTDIVVAPSRCGTIDASGVQYTSDAIRHGLSVPFTLASDGEIPTGGVVFTFKTVGGLSEIAFRPIAPSEMYYFPTFASAMVSTVGATTSRVVAVGLRANCTITIRGGSACVPTGGDYALLVSPTDGVELPNGRAQNMTIASKTSEITFPITPLRTSCEHNALVTIRWDGVVRTLPWVPLFEASVLYTPPTICANLSIVDLSGAVLSAMDASVTTLVLGASYGRAAVVNRGCGVGCTSVLTIQIPTNGHLRVEVPPTGAVWATDASGVRFGTMGAYVYDRASGTVNVDVFTLGADMPMGGWVRFVVQSVGPDGMVGTAATSERFSVVDGPMSAVVESLVFAKSSSVDVRLRTRTLGVFDTLSDVRALSFIDAAKASYGNIPTLDDAAFVERGVVRLPFSCEIAPPVQTVTITLVVAGTRTRVSASIPFSAISIAPTDLTSRLWFSGRGVSDADQNIRTLALGATYGCDASGGFRPCGDDNVSNLVLELNGRGAITNVSRVWAFDTYTKQVYGKMGAWSLDARSQTITVRVFTLPTDILPSCGTVGFGVTLTMPDGSQSSLIESKSTRVISTPTSVEFQCIGRTPYVITDNRNYPTPAVMLVSKTPQSTWPIGASFPNGTPFQLSIADVQCSTPAFAVGVSDIVPLASNASFSVPIRLVEATAAPSRVSEFTVVLATSRVRLVARILPSQIHTLPTLAVATVSFGGSSGVTSSDQSIGALALGAVYGADASGGGVFANPVCGIGNTSAVCVALGGGSPPADEFATEVVRVAAVDASGRSYGTVGAYTYDRGTMSIDVRSFVLPVHSLPAGGVRFSMVVGAYGTQLTLLTQAFPVVCVPTVVELGRIGRSSYALVDGQSVNVPFTLRNASSAVPIDVALRTSTEVVRSCVEWRPSSSFAVDTSGLALVSSTSVSTTVTARVVASRATIESVAVAIIHVQTRTRIALPVSSDIVYAYPTAVYFALRSGPYARMNTSTPIIATFESVIRLPLPIGASYSITATGGSVANASSAALPSDTSGLAFSFTPSVDAETTARVTMTFGGTQVALTGVLLRDDQILGPPVMSLSDRVLVYNTPSVVAMSFADATSLLWPFFGTTVGDMVQYVKWTRGTSPVTHPRAGKRGRTNWARRSCALCPWIA